MDRRKRGSRGLTLNCRHAQEYGGDGWGIEKIGCKYSGTQWADKKGVLGQLADAGIPLYHIRGHEGHLPHDERGGQFQEHDRNRCSEGHIARDGGVVARGEHPKDGLCRQGPNSSVQLQFRQRSAVNWPDKGFWMMRLMLFICNYRSRDRLSKITCTWA